jgi:hypothetical protein
MPVSLLPRVDAAVAVLPADVRHIIDVSRDLTGARMDTLEGVRFRLFAGRARMGTLGAYSASVQAVYDAAERSAQLGDRAVFRPPPKTFWWYVDKLATLGFGISHVAVAAAARTEVDARHYARVVAPWLAAGLPLKIGDTTFKLNEMPIVPFDALTDVVEARVADVTATNASTE